MWSETNLNAHLLKGEMACTVTHQNKKCELAPEP